MQGFMIILLILKSFAFCVYKILCWQEKRFSTDGKQYFYSKFSI